MHDILKVKGSFEVGSAATGSIEDFEHDAAVAHAVVQALKYLSPINQQKVENEAREIMEREYGMKAA